MSTEELFGAVGAAVAEVARKRGRSLECIEQDFITCATAAAMQRDERATWLILSHFIENTLGGLSGVQPIVMPLSGGVVLHLTQRLCVYAAVIKQLGMTGMLVTENEVVYAAAENSVVTEQVNAVTKAYDARISAIRGNRPDHATIDPEDTRLILLACAELLIEMLRKDGEV